MKAKALSLDGRGLGEGVITSATMKESVLWLPEKVLRLLRIARNDTGRRARNDTGRRVRNDRLELESMDHG